MEIMLLLRSSVERRSQVHPVLIWVREAYKLTFLEGNNVRENSIRTRGPSPGPTEMSGLRSERSTCTCCSYKISHFTVAQGYPKERRTKHKISQISFGRLVSSIIWFFLFLQLSDFSWWYQTKQNEEDVTDKIVETNELVAREIQNHLRGYNLCPIKVLARTSPNLSLPTFLRVSSDWDSLRTIDTTYIFTPIKNSQQSFL